MNNDADIIPDAIDAKEVEYLYLNHSELKGAGKGLFTSIKIYKDEVISLFKGEILSDKEAAFRAKNNLDGYFINMLDGTIMDSNKVKCFAKYANDAEGFSTMKFKNNSKITLDENEEVCLVALRNIKVGEEIFCSYGKEYWKKFMLSRQT
jgi:SET domain-containing protein